MKANIMKISVLATILIFLSAGASWADHPKKRYYNKVEDKHIRGEYRDGRDYGKRSRFDHDRYDHRRHHYTKHNDRHRIAHWNGKHAFKHRHGYHRPVYKHDHYRHERRHGHYHRHKPVYKTFTFRAPAFEPGWSVTIKSKSGW